MRISWIPIAEHMPLPPRRQVFEAVRIGLWDLSQGGLRLVHRRSLSLEVERLLRGKSFDVSWMNAADNDDWGAAQLLAFYKGLLASSEIRSRRFSLARVGLISKWGAYMCILPPRRMRVPGTDVEVLLTLEPAQSLQNRFGHGGGARFSDHGFAYVPKAGLDLGDYMEQDARTLLGWPDGLPMKPTRDQLRAWVLVEALQAKDHGSSKVVEEPSWRSVRDGSIRGALRLRPMSQWESLARLITRPLHMWGNMVLREATFAVVPARLMEDWGTGNRLEYPLDTIALFQESPDKGLQVSVSGIDPYYRSFVLAAFAAPAAPLKVSRKHGKPVLVVPPDVYPRGPALTLFNLVTDLPFQGGGVNEIRHSDRLTDVLREWLQ